MIKLRLQIFFSAIGCRNTEWVNNELHVDLPIGSNKSIALTVAQMNGGLRIRAPLAPGDLCRANELNKELYGGLRAAVTAQEYIELLYDIPFCIVNSDIFEKVLSEVLIPIYIAAELYA